MLSNVQVHVYKFSSIVELSANDCIHQMKLLLDLHIQQFCHLCHINEKKIRIVCVAVVLMKRKEALFVLVVAGALMLTFILSPSCGRSRGPSVWTRYLTTPAPHQ